MKAILSSTILVLTLTTPGLAVQYSICDMDTQPKTCQQIPDKVIDGLLNHAPKEAPCLAQMEAAIRNAVHWLEYIARDERHIDKFATNVQAKSILRILEDTKGCWKERP